MFSFSTFLLIFYCCFDTYISPLLSIYPSMIGLFYFFKWSDYPPPFWTPF